MNTNNAINDLYSQLGYSAGGAPPAHQGGGPGRGTSSHSSSHLPHEDGVEM